MPQRPSDSASSKTAISVATIGAVSAIVVATVTVFPSAFTSCSTQNTNSNSATHVPNAISVHDTRDSTIILGNGNSVRAEPSK